MSVDLAVAIRDALVAEASVTDNLDAYYGSFPVFTRRPVPADSPDICVVVSPDITSVDDDGVSDLRPMIERDVAVYGPNDAADGGANYTLVETIAYAIKNFFHRTRTTITVSGWSVTQIVARGPVAAPTDDQQTVGRVVTLGIQLAQAA